MIEIVSQAPDYVSPRGVRIRRVMTRCTTCGAQRVWRVDNLAAASGCPSCRRQDGTSYRAQHTRVAKVRGRAANDPYGCRSCGQPAQEWAYFDHGGTRSTDGGREYSRDPFDYEALCVSCHRKADAAHRAVEAAFEAARLAHQVTDLSRERYT